MSVEDFWPDDLLEDLPTSPKDILAQQAGLLGEKTKNIVLGQVNITSHSEDRFVARLYLRVPALGDYRLELIGLMYTIHLYPAKDVATGRQLDDESQLKEYIAQKLHDESTKKIIRALV